MYRLIKNIVLKLDVKLKFILIGVWNTIFAMLIFVLLDAVLMHCFSRRYMAYMCSMALANILSIINAFIFHKYLTFQSKAKGKSLVLEFIRFCSTYLFVFALSMLLLPVLAEIFRITPKVSAVIGILISIAVSYVCHSKFSFRKKDLA